MYAARLTCGASSIRRPHRLPRLRPVSSRLRHGSAWPERFRGCSGHLVPLHHLAAEYLDGYVEVTGLADAHDAPLWQNTPGRGGRLSGAALSQRAALDIVKRRCRAARLPGDICNHSFRATGMTLYWRRKAAISKARAGSRERANIKTTQLYNRSGDRSASRGRASAALGDWLGGRHHQQADSRGVSRALRRLDAGHDSDRVDSADVRCDSDYQPPCSGARRSLVEQYYRAVDFTEWKDVRKILRVYEAVLAKLEEANPFAWANPEAAKRELATLTKLLERDGFRYENGRITHKGQVASLPMVHEAAAALDVPELHRQLVRLQEAHEDDPGLAIGTAKELVETACKTILHARKVAFSESADITELVKETRKVLELLPDNVPSAAKGADAIRRILSNLGTIAQGLGELRNLYGTGHGKAGAARGLSARHARLAVGSAATLATFLLETHEARGDDDGAAVATP
jgi:hypothetical protein